MALTWPPVGLHRDVNKITPAPLWYIPEHCLNNIVFYVATSDNLTNNRPHVPLCSVTGWGGTRRGGKADAKTMQIRKSGPPFSRERETERERIPLSSWIGAVCHHKKGCRFLAPQQWVMFGRPLLNDWLLFIRGHTQRDSSFLPQTWRILKILCRSSKISQSKSKRVQLASLFLFIKPGSTHASPLQQTRGSSSVFV